MSGVGGGREVGLNGVEGTVDEYSDSVSVMSSTISTVISVSGNSSWVVGGNWKIRSSLN